METPESIRKIETDEPPIQSINPAGRIIHPTAAARTFSEEEL
jgi:hypothetical protein